MRRLLLAVGLLVLALGVAFLLFFTASEYRTEDQSYFESLSDFVFMIRSYNAQLLDSPPPALTDASYERVMAHARWTGDGEVRRRVVWSLARWGEEVVPRLLRELEDWKSPGRVLLAARALGELRAEAAAPALEVALEMARSERGLLVRLIDAYGELGPAATPALIASYKGYRARNEEPPYNLLEAIGRSGGGTEFLIGEMGRARTTEEILALEWPLAFTRDRRAATVLAGLLHHPSVAVRRRARDSMTQSMGEAAIEPVVDVLEVETDDYVRSSILQRILASRATASSDRAVELLGMLLDDPVVSWEANYALSRVGNERAIEILHQRAAGKPPREVMDNLEYTGALALRILDDYIGHEDPYVRRLAIHKLTALEDSLALPLLASALDDSDEPTRRYAREAVFLMDFVLLEESARNWMLEKTGKIVGRLRPPEREGTGTALAVLAFLHWVGLGASSLLGLLLLSGWLRAFEHYKLTLVLTFLLVLGVVGDFFFLAEPSLYRFATGSRLLLLLGLLFLRDDPLPGETRARLDRLVLRGLWIVLPLVLFYGTPILSEGLRYALRDFEFLKWALLLLLVLVLLVFEQAVVPWDFFPRGSRIERAMAFLLSSAVLWVFAAAVFRWMESPAVASDEDRFLFGGILLLPFLVAWIFHLRTSRLMAPLEAASNLTLTPPPPGLRVVRDREGLVIRLGRKRRVPGLGRFILGAFLLGGTWWLVDAGRVASAGAPALVLLGIVLVLAIALLWVVLSGLVGGVAIQIRGNAVRAATTFLGGAFGRPPWLRRPRVPAVLERLSLEREEKKWLAAAVRGAQAPPAPELTFSLAQPGGGAELRVENVGASPASIADYEAAAGEPLRLELDGKRRDVFLSRADREGVLRPGATRTLRARIYPLVVALLISVSVSVDAAIVAEEPSDYTRVLEAGPPALWNEAVEGLLGEKDELPLHAVSSVMRRYSELEPKVQVRVVRALRHHGRHPRTVETLVPLVREAQGELQDAAVESLFALRTPAAMDAFRDLIHEGSPHALGALEALYQGAEYGASPVSPQDFDERYFPAVTTLLRSEDRSVRLKAMRITFLLDTPGLRDEWARALDDPDGDVRWKALWALAERGDPRPCPALVDWARSLRVEPDTTGRIGQHCARSFLLDYIQAYQEATGDSEKAFYAALVEGGLLTEFLDEPEMVAALDELVDDGDPFLREKVGGFLAWGEQRAREAKRQAAWRGAALPLFLVAAAAVSAVLGALLFVWSFRLWFLAARVRNRPVSRAGSVASGPVALEGEAQPAGSFLRHPVTGEPCLYYAGADIDHPEARFYLEDESGRVLVDPRRAVLFTEDGVLVSGERVHVVGFARGRDPVVVGKDDAPRPLYSRLVHGLISALLGIGRSTSVTKMLFSDPQRCFWIWDDLERRPMGERSDPVWLAAGVLLGGAWVLVFAFSVLGLVDREMSEPLAAALGTLLSGPAP